ncbi:MAG: hypothetical protein LBS26_02410 [Campylobacteraceae bacterium]|nr:hypothetical protein [Campylobacteraceae bacterium]
MRQILLCLMLLSNMVFADNCFKLDLACEGKYQNKYSSNKCYVQTEYPTAKNYVQTEYPTADNYLQDKYSTAPCYVQNKYSANKGYVEDKTLFGF